MSTLGQRRHTLGNAIRYILDYSGFLEEDMTLTTTSVTCPSLDVTISAVTVNPDQTVSFLLAGGVLNEVFTVTIQTHDSRSEIATDTADFLVVAP